MQVEVEFEEGAGGVIDQPNIASVQVMITADKGEIQVVQPIVIGGDTLPTKIQSPRAQTVQERIATFLNLSKDIIFVQET